MRVLNLKLTDWCQHKSLDRDFGEANLIGLLGGNGSGKSNVFKAMEFAATGETKDKLEEHVRDGCELAKVVQTMKVRDDVVVVTRTVKKDGKASAKLEVTGPETSEVFNGVTNVNRELELMLGIDKDLAKTNVFVGQKQLDDILFTTAAKRERAWQRMCGMADAEKVHRNLGDVISELPDEQDFTAQILECGQNVETLEADIEKTEAELEELRKKDEFDLDKIMQAQNALRKCSEARQNLPGLEAALAQATKESTEAAEELCSVKDELDNLKEDENVIKVKEDAVNGLLAKLEATKSTKRIMESAEAELARVQENLAGLPSLDVPQCEAAFEELSASIEEASDRLAAVRAQRDMHEALSKAIECAEGDLAECPLCGSSIEDSAALLMRIGLKVSELTTEQQKVAAENANLRTKLQEGKKELNTHVGMVNSFTERMKHLEENLETYKSEIAAANVGEYDENHLREVVSMLNADRSRITTMRAGLPRLEQAVALAGRHLEAAKDNLDKCRKESDAYPAEIDVATELENLKVVHAEAVRIREEISGKEAHVKAQLSSIESWKKSKAELERKAGMGTTHTKIKASLERVRKWFHYSQGPHKLSMAVLNELTAGVNEFLGTLDGRFYVEPDNDQLMFNIVFVDGRDQPETPRSATRGSGGEKSSLATAFRLASYYMFAGQLGLLCLDEPTEYLDARKVEAFGRVIEQLKEISGQLDLQIFMATHRTNFTSLFDEVVNFYDTDESA